jgi:ligand-binding sensor domain-containing protein/signal transduction histidine kinase
MVLFAATAYGARLTARVYTTGDGLANDRVDRGTRDARGYLWFATADGVSRFDGQRFDSFGVADGLPAAEAHDILATRDGAIWVATEGGLAWLDTAASATRARFQAVGSHADVLALHEDATGVLWAGTRGGLVRVRLPGAAIAPVRVPLDAAREPSIYCIASDARDHSLWLGTHDGVWHRTASGEVERYRVGPADSLDDRVMSILVDRAGRLWIGHAGAMLVAMAVRPGERLAPAGQGLWDAAGRAVVRFAPHGGVRRNIVEDSRGTVWIGTTDELLRYDGALRVVDGASLPIDHALGPCVEDAAGNLWFGSNTQGVMRLAPGGMVTYDRRDGLDSDYLHGFVEAPGGPLYAVTWRDGHTLARFGGTRFTAVRPRVPEDVSVMGWGWGQTALIDRDGRWWYPTGQGLARYPAGVAFEALAATLPELFVRPDQLPGRDIFRLYEDRRGDVWISTLSATGLARWDRATGEIRAVSGLPAGAALAFAEDRAGALWIGTSDGYLVRMAAGAPPRVLGPGDGVPRGEINALLVDGAGRLWAAHGGAGVTRLDDPGAAYPGVRRVTAADGLGTDQAVSLVDDAYGRIYIGTSRGVDRLDPATGRITHLDTADGLPNDYIYVAHRDASGALWFGTKAGAARLSPAAPGKPAARPAVYITRVAIAGAPQPLAVDGARRVALELGPEGGPLDIAFTSPSFAVGERVRFQYCVEGAHAGWTAPALEREVHFARLAAGGYRFRVRAVSSSGATSEPAEVAFEVLPHVWRRGWFLALCAAAIGLALHRVHRMRLRHALAIERVRTRIASDLHDELGANLSRIAILAEVADRRAAVHPPLSGPIRDIGRSARELVEVAADIVWSTDPRRDDLGSVIVRLRRFAADVLEGRNMTWTLEAPPDPGRIKLAPDQRRHLHLIVKEAIHNAAKHSAARHVAISIARAGGGLAVTVRDDGRGLPVAASGSRGGNGLANMRARAAEAGGTLAIDSRIGQGTTIALRLGSPP